MLARETGLAKRNLARATQSNFGDASSSRPQALDDRRATVRE
jgi:hypothetical protein